MYKVVIGSKYQKDGEVKARWTAFGSGYEKENGNFTIRLDHTVIVPAGESVWLNMFKQENQNALQKKDE
jgi:hypothetical protein